MHTNKKCSHLIFKVKNIRDISEKRVRSSENSLIHRSSENFGKTNFFRTPEINWRPAAIWGALIHGWILVRTASTTAFLTLIIPMSTPTLSSELAWKTSSLAANGRGKMEWEFLQTPIPRGLSSSELSMVPKDPTPEAVFSSIWLSLLVFDLRQNSTTLTGLFPGDIC